MDHPWWVRVGLVLFAVLLLFYGFYWFSNMICRSSVRYCTATVDCPAASACVDYGSESICAPEYCADRKDWSSIPMQAHHILQIALFQVARMTSLFAGFLVSH